MAWWQTQLILRGDTLIAETLNDAGLGPIQFSSDPATAPEGEPLTAIVVSGYALYGELRGYYALGVGHMRVDWQSGTGYMSEPSAAHQEPATLLSPRQKQAIREWLRAYNPAAWETSLESFKTSLK
ncbi:MAG: hypothetical protein HY782_17735 [Chloroflexi bacterium]|nr:hypothetical protein [Chloroflexota bacterium]